MTPTQINEKHGKPTWKCWSCKSERGLEWWNGVSIAVCTAKPECRKAVGEFFEREAVGQEAYEAHCREYWG